jgi:hypothetical protein
VALTDEQRTMLQLLLEGGQRYDDIGSLLGISADEVRSRARAALQEIGGADPDAQVGLSDYLLGQADPIGRADAVRQLQNDPEANALAERLVQNLRLLAPKAELPEIPEPRGGRRATPPPLPPAPAQAAPASAQASPAAPPTPGAAPPPKGPGFASRVAGAFSGLGGLSGRRRTQFAVGLGAALALVIVVVVVATSGGSDGSGDCSSVNPTQTSLANATLDATGPSAEKDCQPSGVVSLVPVGQTKNGQPQLAGFAFEMKAANLEPTSGNDVYVLWLDAGNGQARALGRQTVDDSGNLTGDAALTSTDLALLQSGSFKLSRVTQAQQQQIQQALQSQGKRPTGLVSFVGTPVLQGSASSMVQQLQTVLQQLQQQQQQSGGAGAQGQSGGTQPNPNQGAGKNG